jgi:hypothetical protein
VTNQGVAKTESRRCCLLREIPAKARNTVTKAVRLDKPKDRRSVLKVRGAAALWPVIARAQRRGSVPVVGMMVTHPPVDGLVVDEPREGLRGYNYVGRTNCRVELRSDRGHLQRVPALLGALIQEADVLVVVNEGALRVAQKATPTVPVVMIGFMDDPVELGNIEGYRKPGGDNSGVFNVNSELSGKRLEILRDALPVFADVAALWDAFGGRQVREMQDAADMLRIRLERVEIEDGEALERPFVRARQAGAPLPRKCTFCPCSGFTVAA